jgi:methyl-accepting chemotaxis protein
VSASLHGIAFEGLEPANAAQDLARYVEAVLLVFVTISLGNAWGMLLARLEHTRARLSQIESGSLSERLTDDEADDLGAIGRSINRVLDQVAESAAVLLSEADQVANAAAQLGRSTQSLVQSSQVITDAVAQTTGDMGQTAAGVEDDLATATDLAGAADAVAERAKRVLADGSAMTAAAAEGADRLKQTSTELLTFGEDVRGTGAAVADLSASSKRIGEFALAISKIARQTHILALNAAIEAARAAEHGHGFAVVAEQVRGLAGEAGRSARDVSDVVAELREGIEKVAVAISHGEDKIREVALAASEAQGTLGGLGPGLDSALELASETASLSKAQVARITLLQERIAALREQKERWVGEVEVIDGAVRIQADALDDLGASGQKLTELTQRLRETTTHIRETTYADG